MKNRGFTLVELMVAISIVALLSSVVMYSTAQARAKADDAKKKAEIGQVKVALALHKDGVGRVPYSYNCSGAYCSGGGGNAIAVEGTPAYRDSMQELVTRGYLSAIPKSRDNSYVYYADPTADTAAFGATLQTGTAQASKNSCPYVPAARPYSECVSVWSVNNAPPYHSDPSAVVFRYPEVFTSFCPTYGSPLCHPGGNGMYASACVNNPPDCISPSASLIISCLPNPAAASTCTGSGNDFCACVQ